MKNPAVPKMESSKKNKNKFANINVHGLQIVKQAGK